MVVDAQNPLRGRHHLTNLQERSKKKGQNILNKTFGKLKKLERWSQYWLVSNYLIQKCILKDKYIQI